MAYTSAPVALEFQSTLPRGERRFPAYPFTQGIQFQSTLPRGERRHFSPGLYPFHMISIHAPARGATRLRRRSGRDIRNFNPRSREGSDAFWLAIETPIENFNPRSREGSDSNFTQNSISVLFHFYQSFPYIIFPHTALFRLLIIFCTFFLVRIAQGFPVCFHFAPKQYPAFYNVCSTDLL